MVQVYSQKKEITFIQHWEEDMIAMESARKMKYSSHQESMPKTIAKTGRKFIVYKKQK